MALIGRNIFIGSDEKIFIGTDRYDTTTQPTSVGIITASDGVAEEEYGKAVAVGSDIIVVGVPESIQSGLEYGAIYIYDLNGNNEVKKTSSDIQWGDYFGNSVAVGCGKIVVGALGEDQNAGNAGAAYIYDLDGTNEVKIIASDGAGEGAQSFGNSVAVGSGKIVVGAYYRDVGSNEEQGAAYIYNLDGTNEIKIVASDGAYRDQFGQSVAVGSGRIVVGAWGGNYQTVPGSAYIFDLDGNQLSILTDSNGNNGDEFGASVAVGSGRIVVGAPGYDADTYGNGAIYIYDLDGTQVGIITGHDGTNSNNFGYSVAIGDGKIVVGDINNSTSGSSDGAAHVYDLDGNYISKLTHPNGENFDYFGISVAVGSGKIVVGAHWDDVNSNNHQGSAHIYNTPESDHIFDILD